jgi:hypothetical protein
VPFVKTLKNYFVKCIDKNSIYVIMVCMKIIGRKYFVICVLFLINIGCVGDNSRRDIINEDIVTEENIIIEISDLNGTWLPDWYNRVNYIYQIREVEYSWGIAKSAIYSSFDIDINNDFPFIHPPGMRAFSIINIIKQENNSIILHANTPDVTFLPDDWYFEIFFYFLDKDTIQIETKEFHETFTEGENIINPYGGTEIWHRLSGPIHNN